VKIGALDSSGNGIAYNDLPYLNVPIQESEIAPNTIVENKIVDSAVTTAKLADSSVTEAKIANDAVTADKIAHNTILTGNIASGAINTQSIADDAVTYAKVQNVSSGNVLLGRQASSAGLIQEIECTQTGRDLIASSSAANARAAISAVHQSDVDASIANLVDSAPGTLDTLNELADALGDDENFSTTVATNIANVTTLANTKMPLAGGTFTGEVTYEELLKINKGGTSANPAGICFDGDIDTGIFQGSITDTMSFTAGGSRRMHFVDDITYFDRAANLPTIKASTAASGYMIIDSNSSAPVSINHYSDNDIWLNYNSDGNAGSTLIGPPTTSSSAGTHKLKVFGTAQVTGDFFAGIANGGAVYHSVARAGYLGTQGVTNCAYSITGDGNTGLYFPNQFSSSAAAGTTGDEIALATAGVTRLHIDSQGATALGAAPISVANGNNSHYGLYQVIGKTEHDSLQGSVNSVTHTVTDAAQAYHTIGVNGSAYKTITSDNVTEAGGYVRGGHFAASTRTQTGCTSGQTIGVYSVAQHLNSTAGSTQLVGGQFLCYQSSPGSIAVGAYGVFARCAITSLADASSIITNAYALYSDVTKSTGTITNGYGLLIGDIDATNKYGVYVNDTDAINVYKGTSKFGATKGSAGSLVPGITFDQDPDTGFGKNVGTGNVIDVITGGSMVGFFSTGGIRMIDGTSSVCSYAFTGDADTGMFRSTSTGLNLQWSGSGIQIASAYINNQKQLRIPDGTADDPAIAFANDPDTGIKRNANGNMDLVWGKSNKISITSQGSTLGGTVTISNGLAVSNLAQSSASTDEFLKWNGAAWVPASPTINNISDVTVFPSSGEVLYYNGTNWENKSASAVIANASIGDLGNVSSATPSTGNVLTWSGSAWAPAAPTGGSGGSGSSTLVGLTDVTVSSAASGEVLYWNGSGWVNQDLGLHAVATSGSYNDLANKPTYSTVATSGSYTDLANIPSTFAPSTHVHPISAVTNLQTELNGKAASSHSHSQSEITDLVSDLASKATLVGGKVASAQLPSFVDDVEEYNGTSAFPSTGETGKIYVDTSTNKTHRWTGSTYIEISPSPGTTDDVAEGSTNLYFTNARADARVANSIINDGSLTANSTTKAASQSSVKGYADNIYTTVLGMLASTNATVQTKAATSSLKPVATGGNYSDLNNIPSTFAPSSHTHPYSAITGRVETLDDLDDVSLASPSAGDILRYNGSSWVKENPELISTINTTSTNRAIALNYNFAQSFVANMQSSALHTVTLTNWPTTNPLRVLTATLIMKFPGTGGAATTATVSWPSSVKWPGGTAPTITNKAGAIDVFSFVSYDNGASWLGFTGGQEF
jgi:hypothetical protein